MSALAPGKLLFLSVQLGQQCFRFGKTRPKAQRLADAAQSSGMILLRLVNQREMVVNQVNEGGFGTLVQSAGEIGEGILVLPPFIVKFAALEGSGGQRGVPSQRFGKILQGVVRLSQLHINL